VAVTNEAPTVVQTNPHDHEVQCERHWHPATIREGHA
jgi:hypothetical protein